jgi:DNA-binding beta-propeller fold protein YncE
MRSLKILKFTLLAIAAICLAVLNGCGGGSGANVVSVSVVSSSGSTIIVGSSTTLTATVSGATNLGVNWETPQYTTTTIANGKSTTSAATNIPTDGSMGTLTNETTTSPATATYTAPAKLPDQTKFPGLQIIITAQSQQNTSKTGTLNPPITLDSGIGESLTPSTASVPTNEPQTFTAVLTNDTQNLGVTYLLTQQTTNVTNPPTPEPQLASCSPSCGSVQSTGLYTATYTAPSTVPTACSPAPASGVTCTAADVTIVATSKADNTRFVIGTITIVQGGPITFNGISPTIAPQGAAFWDVYLDAPNISSASKITITDQNNGTKTFSSNDSTNQIKVLFPIPTTTTTNPTSTGARLRLLESDLLGATPATPTTPITYTFSVSDPGEPVTQTSGGSFTLTLIPVRPTVISSTPDSVVQGDALINNFNLAIDGGYFGPGGTFADVTFQGNTVPRAARSNSQQIISAFATSAVAAGPPGLYPLSVTRTATPPAAVTTIGIFPDYSAATPKVVSANATSMANPSAIDIDPTLGVIAVAEAGPGTAPGVVEFFNISAAAPFLTSAGAAVPVGTLPTGLSVNRTNHTVAVVNYGSNNVTVVPIPGGGQTFAPYNVDLSGVLQGVASPAPLPYAIGVDPDTNLALVAFSCTSISCTLNGNLGFVVNLNQGANPHFGCINDTSSTKNPGPCVYSQVTLNTGGAPQIAMAPHGHLAYVTPGEASLGGGAGVISGIDVTHASTSVGISTAALNAGSVTVTTSANLTGLVPGIPATVLISGMPAPPSSANCPSGTNFNGIFSIFVTGNTTFTYVLNPNGTGTCTVSGTPGTSNVFYGTPNLSFGGVSSGAQGIAINPITHTAAIANPNANGFNGTQPQINLLNQLNLSVTSISFASSCTFYNSSTCPSAGADQGSADVAWQPYTNSVVSYNPKLNQVSVSDPVSQARRALACATASCSPTAVPPGSITLPGTGQATLTVQNGTTNSLTLWGGIAVDPATDQAFVVQSGSGTIQVVSLDGSQPIKPVNVSEVVVPSTSGVPGSIGGLPGGFLPQGTVTSTSPLSGVKVFGSGFVQGATSVFLDGQDITLAPAGPGGSVTFVSAREVDVTIPATPFLSMPHRFALTVSSGGSTSNPTDFIVVKAIDFSTICNSNGTPINTQPSSVAIADQLAEGAFTPIAVVTNSGCNSISIIDINPASPTFGTVTNPLNNALPATFSVGATPQGIAISQHLGLAVVANNGDGTASVVNLINALKGASPVQPVAAVATGTGPTGVAINDATGAALVTNFSANTVSEINLGLLFGSSPATSLTATSIGGVQQPIAVAIDPDAGTNHQGLAVVTGFQTLAGSSNGALYPVDIGAQTPILSTTVTVGSVSSTPTGIVFDPAVNTGSVNPGLFYVNSSGADTIMSYNDNTGGTSTASVGINPTALAVNPQTGAILTSNFGGQSASIVDTLSNPFKTRQTLGLPGSAQFGVAIDQFTNLAVIVDQGYNRVLLFAMPN